MLAAAKAGTQETADTPDASDDMDTDSPQLATSAPDAR
jgi:hypothetical protein